MQSQRSGDYWLSAEPRWAVLDEFGVGFDAVAAEVVSYAGGICEEYVKVYDDVRLIELSWHYFFRPARMAIHHMVMMRMSSPSPMALSAGVIEVASLCFYTMFSGQLGHGTNGKKSPSGWL